MYLNAYATVYFLSLILINKFKILEMIKMVEKINMAECYVRVYFKYCFLVLPCKFSNGAYFNILSRKMYTYFLIEYFL